MPAIPERAPLTRSVVLSEEELQRMSRRRGQKSRRTRRSKKYMRAEMREVMPIRIPRGATLEGVPVRVVEE